MFMEAIRELERNSEERGGGYPDRGASVVKVIAVTRLRRRAMSLLRMGRRCVSSSVSMRRTLIRDMAVDTGTSLLMSFNDDW